MTDNSPIAVCGDLMTTSGGEPRLIGSRCRVCGEITFPRQDSCPACCADGTEDYVLARRGRLWTWTVQNFLPKSPPYAGQETPDRFKPYGVGYVELPNEVRVEARLTENDPDKLRIGMEMELVTLPFAADGDGRELITFAFAPVPQN